MNVWSAAFINKQVKQSVRQWLLLYCFNQKSQSVHVSSKKIFINVIALVVVIMIDCMLSSNWVSKFWRATHCETQ